MRILFLELLVHRDFDVSCPGPCRCALCMYVCIYIYIYIYTHIYIYTYIQTDAGSSIGEAGAAGDVGAAASGGPSAGGPAPLPTDAGQPSAAATGDAASAGAGGDFVAASPPSPVLGAFVFRNWAGPGALPNTSSALGGGRAPAQDTLCAGAAGRLPTAAGQPTPGGGGAKSTGKAAVSSFMVSTLSMCVPRMHACVPRMRGAQPVTALRQCIFRAPRQLNASSSCCAWGCAYCCHLSQRILLSTHERMTQFVCCR